MDNTLAFLDQASFLRLRATGKQSLCQCSWVYDRPLDPDGLRRFHHNLGRGLLGRRIERSPLPFGRHRWVACRRSSDIDFAASPRPRADVSAWIDERARVPIDPEFGPGWHLGVLELLDGGAAATLVASHSVVDGLGLTIAITEAASGEVPPLGYPPPWSRSRLRALQADGRDFVRSVPAALRALIVTIAMLIRLERGPRREPTPPVFPVSRADRDGCIVLPAVAVYVDLASWEARADELGGTSNSLFVALAARLAQRMGRVQASDGTVTITVPVSERTADDMRANALTSTTFRVDPTRVTDDLQHVREKIKQGLAALHEIPNELLQSLPLIPMVPKWLARKMEAVAMGSSDRPVGCSNLGALDPALSRLDGTDATYVSMRLAEQGVTEESTERSHGQLYLGSGHINGKLFVTVVAYQHGIENSRSQLRELVVQTLADFRLTALADQ